MTPEREIAKMLILGDMTSEEIIKKFNVSRTRIYELTDTYFESIKRESKALENCHNCVGEINYHCLEKYYKLRL